MITWGESGGDGWTATAADSDTLYIGTRHGQILALSGVTGDSPPRIEWIFNMERDHGVFGMPAVTDRYLYVGDKGNPEGRDGQLLALLKDREPVAPPSNSASLLQEGEWSATVAGAVVGGPVVVEEEELVLASSDDGNLYAFNITGDSRDREAWRFATDGEVWSTPAVADGMVYFGSMDQHIYAISLQRELPPGEGRLQWRFKTDGAVVGSPVVVDGPTGKLAVVGSLDRNVYAIDVTTGELVWSFEGDNWFWASPVFDGERIYVASMGSTVYALDLEGNEVWGRPLEGSSPIVSKPLLLGEDLVVATDEGRLYRLDVRSGNRVGAFHHLDGRVKADLSYVEGTVFVGVEDDTVRAFNLEDWRQTWTFPTREQ